VEAGRAPPDNPPPDADYSALERELNAKNTKSSESSSRRYDDEDDYSAYAEKYAKYDDEV